MAYPTTPPPANHPAHAGWINLASSCIARVRVDGSPTASAVRLVVEFQSGARYEYRGVDHVTVGELLGAASPGRYFNQNIRDAFVAHRI